ncbi:MAG: lipase family protein [Phycisphaerales bacterium]|nr:lipase family protein [Phycisphaerales bacterium]
MRFTTLNSNLFLCFIGLFFIVAPCCKKNNNVQQATSTIVSQKLVKQLNTSDVINTLKLYLPILPESTKKALNSFIAKDIKYAVNVYSITYTTTLANGSSIVASGAIFCPQGSKALRLASYQHSTTTDMGDIPSNYGNIIPGGNKGAEATLMALPFAANGYVVSCPDYIGFGSTYGKVESYITNQTITNTFDMLQATKEFIKQQNISLNDDSIAIYGYSEGGFASLGLHKMVEAQTQWPVSLDFSGSGPYDIKGMLDSILNLTAIPGKYSWNFMATYGLTLYSLLSYYQLPASLNIEGMINQPWLKNLLQSNTILWPYTPSNLTNDTPSIFFKSAFIDGIKNNTGDFGALNQLLKATAVYNWKPQYPVTLFAGSIDSFVFTTNADSAYNAITRNGGKYIPLDVANNYNYIYPGADHFSGFLIYLEYLYNKFALNANAMLVKLNN